MTLTLTHYGTTHTVSMKRNDLSLYEMGYVLHHALLALGYAPTQVNELLPIDEMEVPTEGEDE